MDMDDTQTSVTLIMRNPEKLRAYSGDEIFIPFRNIKSQVQLAPDFSNVP